MEPFDREQIEGLCNESMDHRASIGGWSSVLTKEYLQYVAKLALEALDSRIEIERLKSGIQLKDSQLDNCGKQIQHLFDRLFKAYENMRPTYQLNPNREEEVKELKAKLKQVCDYNNELAGDNRELKMTNEALRANEQATWARVGSMRSKITRLEEETRE